MQLLQCTLRCGAHGSILHETPILAPFVAPCLISGRPVMPAHVLFLARHALIGFALAACFVGTMAWFDIAGLRTLAAKSDSTLVAFPVLTFFLGLTFASVQMGAAIMLLPHDEKGGGGGGGSSRVGAWLAHTFGPPATLAPVRAGVRR